MSEDCAVTTHPLLTEVASTSILVIVATMRLLSLRLLPLLKAVVKPMKHTRIRISEITRMVSVFMLSALLRGYPDLVQNESPMKVYTNCVSKAIKRV
jgi:hypothetical protein